MNTIVTPSSRLYGLSDKQQESIDIFRKLLLSRDMDLAATESDSELSRWLRVNKWNLEAAFSMYKTNKCWLKFSLTAQLMDRGGELLRDIGKVICRSVWGEDLEGRPVMYFFVNKSKYGEVAQSLPTDYLIAAMLKKARDSVEICVEQSRKHGMLVDQYTNIIDLQGLNLSLVKECASKMVKQMTAATHSNFPDSANQILIINGPSAILKPAYELIKPFLAESTQQKIKPEL
ncbi:hypothetical protein Ciccas_007673 [Cichlidogyrus casuarinus]|uniref:CRAL-TRIO domain-containing protein n=1 Tax=Cichlidogyrus casuarinus TaxID=1844966 RepID=A0ABD2Q279_9PLAT